MDANYTYCQDGKVPPTNFKYLRESETRQWLLAQTEACAPLEEGIVNMKAIDPAHRAGLETITHLAAAAIASGGRNHPRLGASALGSDDN